jgi:hypothetical protein
MGVTLVYSKTNIGSYKFFSRVNQKTGVISFGSSEMSMM